MAIPAPVVSNPITVTVAPAAETITIAPTTPPAVPPAFDFPSAGGSDSFTGTTNEPDGTVLHVLLDGNDTGGTVTASGGAFSGSVTIPVNNSIDPAGAKHVITVSK